MEIPGVIVSFAWLQPAARVTCAQIFDLHHLGPQPGQRFGARRTRLELREIDDANALQTIEFDGNAHRRCLRCAKTLIAMLIIPVGSRPTDSRWAKAPGQPRSSCTSGSMRTRLGEARARSAATLHCNRPRLSCGGPRCHAHRGGTEHARTF